MFGRSLNKIVDHSQFGEFPLFLKLARPKRNYDHRSQGGMSGAKHVLYCLT